MPTSRSPLSCSPGSSPTRRCRSPARPSRDRSRHRRRLRRGRSARRARLHRLPGCARRGGRAARWRLRPRDRPRRGPARGELGRRGARGRGRAPRLQGARQGPQPLPPVDRGAAQAHPPRQGPLSPQPPGRCRQPDLAQDRALARRLRSGVPRRRTPPARRRRWQALRSSAPTRASRSRPGRRGRRGTRAPRQRAGRRAACRSAARSRKTRRAR